jgi:hypothetical protein
MEYIIVYLLFAHFVADFVCQSREMGQKKSEYAGWLFKHLSHQVIVFTILLSFIVDDPGKVVLFALANAAIHGVIDWYIWRLYKYSVIVRKPKELFDKVCDHSNKRCFKYWEDHYFYLTIGLDQMCHGITIVLLAKEIL